MHSPNIIGTLENECALWQANFIKDILEDVGHSCVLKILKDEDADANNVNYSRVLEAALLNDEIDIIVHSYKDIPLGAVPGSIVAAVTERDDPSELLLIRKDGYDAKRKFCLKKNARIGSVSPRRSSQLLAFRRDISIAKIEGDIAMRIKKLREGSCDALLIASALIDRLEIDRR